MFCYVACFSRVEFEIGDGPGWQEPQCRAWMLRRDICRLLSGRWGRSSFFAYYYSSKCLGSSCKFPWFDCFVDVKQCNLFLKKNSSVGTVAMSFLMFVVFCQFFTGHRCSCRRRSFHCLPRLQAPISRIQASILYLQNRKQESHQD